MIHLSYNPEHSFGGEGRVRTLEMRPRCIACIIERTTSLYRRGRNCFQLATKRASGPHLSVSRAMAFSDKAEHLDRRFGDAADARTSMNHMHQTLAWAHGKGGRVP